VLHLEPTDDVLGGHAALRPLRRPLVDHVEPALALLGGGRAQRRVLGPSPPDDVVHEVHEDAVGLELLHVHRVPEEDAHHGLRGQATEAGGLLGGQERERPRRLFARVH
jgi:hypothetical protein